MAPQFLLEGRSLDELTREATELYGADARIVRAERVLDPGVAGFLGRRHLEVMVEVPDQPRPPSEAGPDTRTADVVVAPAGHVLSDRAGILALLDDADSSEDDVNADLVGRADRPTGLARVTGPVGPAGHPGAPDPAGAPGPVAPVVETRAPVPGAPLAGAPVRPATVVPDVSTESPQLTELLARLGDDRAGRAVPAPLSAPGDLVLVVGLGDSALHVTASMLEVAGGGGTGSGWAVYGAGASAPAARPRLTGRWDAVRSRALAVEVGAAVLVACDPGSPTGGLPHLEAAASLAPDQVWVVVDARHKPDDTSAWVDRVRAVMEVDALAVVGAGESLSPHTVNWLRVPVGWVDGMPAPRTVL
ncbi:hypothetical protein [Terrabacter sp. NPDC000476]|uniref:hypothetical protein n=1 Tax=Terrabacter sp. NPDC000476 TaxID=3154258 RepID=UPI00332AE9F8